MKPQEYGLVRMVRPVPERALPVGAEGTIVMVLAVAGIPDGYLVEFPGVPQPDLTTTLVGTDSEVVRRYVNT